MTRSGIEPESFTFRIARIDCEINKRRKSRERGGGESGDGSLRGEKRDKSN